MTDLALYLEHKLGDFQPSWVLTVGATYAGVPERYLRDLHSSSIVEMEQTKGFIWETGHQTHLLAATSTIGYTVVLFPAISSVVEISATTLVCWSLFIHQ